MGNTGLNWRGLCNEILKLFILSAAIEVGCEPVRMCARDIEGCKSFENLWETMSESGAMRRSFVIFTMAVSVL